MSDSLARNFCAALAPGLTVSAPRSIIRLTSFYNFFIRTRLYNNITKKGKLLTFNKFWKAWIASLAWLLSLSTHAAENHEEELDQVRSRIKSITTQLNQDKAKQNTLQHQLAEVEIQMADLNRSLDTTQSKVRSSQEKIQASETEIEQLQHELTLKQSQLKSLVYASYINGRTEYLKLLLNQEDPERLGRAMAYYHYLSRARVNDILKVQELVAQLNGVKTQLRNEHQELKALEADQLLKREQLELARSERSTLLAKLEQQIGSEQEELTQLKQKAARLEKLLDDLKNALTDLPPEGTFNQPFRSMQGQLPLPVNGSISARFGQSKGMGVLWEGIFVDAQEGTVVQSIFPGRVAFADWLRGFGLLLILDHGDGYMSLYSHNQMLHKQVGDWVNADETIAQVGSSGGLKKTGLYFEIRHNGEPHNPLMWCKVE